MRWFSTALFTFATLAGAHLSVAGAQEGSLCTAAGKRFLVGAAITSQQLEDPDTTDLILKQFDCLTPEYEFFPQSLQPSPDTFNFATADRIARFAQQHHLPLTGHMLCWNQCMPPTMFADASGNWLPRSVALQNLRTYIRAVVQHFHGKVDSWNVVNEAISDAPDTYLRETPALKAIGPDYVRKAFEFAHAADPTVALYYNDYNIEDPNKLPKTIRLIRELQADGVRLDAVGVQGHWLLNYPGTQSIEHAIVALQHEGVKVVITELDVDVLPREATADLNHVHATGVNPYAAGIPSAVLQQQADRYAELFRVFIRHSDAITRVAFWGVDDGQSWLNNFPIKGRTNYPLLFDRQLRPKPAFDAVMRVLQAKAATPR